MNKSIQILLSILVLCLMPLNIFGQPVERSDSSYYYTFDRRVPIVKIPGKFMIKKKQDLSKGQLEDIVNSCLGKAEYDWFNEDICTVICANNLVDEAIKRLIQEETILSVRYVYALSQDLDFFSKHHIEEEPLSLGFVDQIVVKYKECIDVSVKEKIQKQYRLNESNDCNRNSIYELYTVAKTDDILNLSNRLFETGYFEFAYPKLITRVSFCDDNAVYPNDPYFQYQVTLHNTGQLFNGHTGTPDADIDAPEAWALTMGHPDIVIAVIDEGVTSNHPDLPNSRQVRLNGSNFGSGNHNDPSPIGNNSHGNACAGVIAATANNGEGIVGIAPLCKIMPIRIDSTSAPEDVADAINFAVDNGAKIISNSWGYHSSSSDVNSSIIDAIEYAINHNVLMVFAAGNSAKHSSINSEDGYVDYPANRNIDGMLSVGASDRYDKQADYSPTDTCIDIVAPSNKSSPYDYRPDSLISERSDMWTIDIPGNNGYNPWPTDQGDEFGLGETLPNSGTNYLSYTGHFGGTSHACPVVAGVAALVLSVNPDLPPQVVCNVLKNSADKVGGYAYDVNGRCDQMGYGRVNANNAVWMVCDTTFHTNDTIINNERTVTGCDVYLENVIVTNNSLLRVNYKNSVTIDNKFYIGNNSILDIKRY